MKRRSKKKKNIFKVIIIVLIIIALMCLLGYYLYDKKQKEIEANRLKVTLSNELTAEINSEVKLNTFVKSIINGEILNGEDLVDTSKLGEQSLILNMKNKDNEAEEYQFTINVIDTEKPIIEAKNR